MLWVSDTAIIQKPMSEKSLYYVADAVTGKPVAGATVEFFGFRQKYVDANVYQLDVKDLAERADENGQVLLPIEKDPQDRYQWVAIATTPDGRLAALLEYVAAELV